MTSEWRNDYRRYANPYSPAIGPDRRRDMIPASAIFIIGDDDRTISPGRTILDRSNQIGDMLLAGHFHGITRMLVIDPSGFDERNSR